MNEDQITWIIFAGLIFIVVLIVVYAQWSDDKKYEAEKEKAEKAEKAETEKNKAQETKYGSIPLLPSRNV